jgi:hypothetical protein
VIVFFAAMLSLFAGLLSMVPTVLLMRRISVDASGVVTVKRLRWSRHFDDVTHIRVQEVVNPRRCEESKLRNLPVDEDGHIRSCGCKRNDHPVTVQILPVRRNGKTVELLDRVPWEQRYTRAQEVSDLAGTPHHVTTSRIFHVPGS